jgi:hypothetical protein
MKRILLAAAVALGGMLYAVPASAQISGGIYVQFGPPAPVYQRVPPPPGPYYVWQPGYYRWDGARYIWVGGRYVYPPYRGAAWVPGHWDRRGRGYYWVQGRWGHHAYGHGY